MFVTVTNNKFRYAISMALAALISSSVAMVWDKHDHCLIALSALYVMQTSIGNALYQGMKKCLQLIVLVLLATWFAHSATFLSITLQNVLIGTAIGIAANLFIFPRKADIEFRQALLPILWVYQNYLKNILECIQKKSALQNNAALEKSILAFPDWVTKRGFDVGLQKGYQFFFIKVEQVAEVLFTLHYLARHAFESDLLEVTEETLQKCAAQIDGFFAALRQALALQPLTHEVRPFEEEINALEKQFYLLAPNSIELLDLREDYIYFAEFIYCLRDLDRYLTKMGEALR